MEYKHGAYVIIDTSKARRINDGSGSPDIPDVPINPRPDVAFVADEDGYVMLTGVELVAQDDGSVMLDGAVFTAQADGSVLINGGD